MKECNNQLTYFLLVDYVLCLVVIVWIVHKVVLVLLRVSNNRGPSKWLLFWPLYTFKRLKVSQISNKQRQVDEREVIGLSVVWLVGYDWLESFVVNCRWRTCNSFNLISNLSFLFFKYFTFSSTSLSSQKRNKHNQLSVLKKRLKQQNNNNRFDCLLNWLTHFAHFGKIFLILLLLIPSSFKSNKAWHTNRNQTNQNNHISNQSVSWLIDWMNELTLNTTPFGVRITGLRLLPQYIRCIKLTDWLCARAISSVWRNCKTQTSNPTQSVRNVLWMFEFECLPARLVTYTRQTSGVGVVIVVTRHYRL